MPQQVEDKANQSLVAKLSGVFYPTVVTVVLHRGTLGTYLFTLLLGPRYLPHITRNKGPTVGSYSKNLFQLQVGGILWQVAKSCNHITNAQKGKEKRKKKENHARQDTLKRQVHHIRGIT